MKRSTLLTSTIRTGVVFGAEVVKTRPVSAVCGVGNFATRPLKAGEPVLMELPRVMTQHVSASTMPGGAGIVSCALCLQFLSLRHEVRRLLSAGEQQEHRAPPHPDTAGASPFLQFSIGEPQSQQGIAADTTPIGLTPLFLCFCHPGGPRSDEGGCFAHGVHHRGLGYLLLPQAYHRYTSNNESLLWKSLGMVPPAYLRCPLDAATAARAEIALRHVAHLYENFHHVLLVCLLLCQLMAETVADHVAAHKAASAAATPRRSLPHPSHRFATLLTAFIDSYAQGRPLTISVDEQCLCQRVTSSIVDWMACCWLASFAQETLDAQGMHTGTAAAPPPPLVAAADMRSMPVKALKALMQAHRISWEGYVEKEDLIGAVERHRSSMHNTSGNTTQDATAGGSGGTPWAVSDQQFLRLLELLDANAHACNVVNPVWEHLPTGDTATDNRPIDAETAQERAAVRDAIDAVASEKQQQQQGQGGGAVEHASTLLHRLQQLLRDAPSPSLLVHNKGMGLFDLASKFNHSCAPNVRFANRSDAPARATVYAISDIAPGEEMLTSYKRFPTENVVERRRAMQGYGFECHCTRCTQEVAERNKNPPSD